MDNNNQIQQPESEGENKKTIMWLIVGLVLVILLVGGIYWYLGKQQETTPQSTPQPPTTESNLERELDAINIEAEDSDFTSVDADLESL